MKLNRRSASIAGFIGVAGVPFCNFLPIALRPKGKAVNLPPIDAWDLVLADKLKAPCIDHDMSMHRCPRCGDGHESLITYRYRKPDDEFTHWAKCPNTGEPFDLKFMHL